MDQKQQYNIRTGEVNLRSSIGKNKKFLRVYPEGRSVYV
jgi:hypothetical protein